MGILAFRPTSIFNRIGTPRLFYGCSTAKPLAIADDCGTPRLFYGCSTAHRVPALLTTMPHGVSTVDLRLVLLCFFWRPTPLWTG